MSLLMLQTEAPLRQAPHNLVCTTHVLRAVNEWSRPFAVLRLLPLPRTTTCGSQTPRSITHGEPPLA